MVLDRVRLEIGKFKMSVSASLVGVFSFKWWGKEDEDATLTAHDAFLSVFSVELYSFVLSASPACI